jgi:bifunctional DNA-binding transcriptional regulator/antitoxin component of YhaV-PrlF toxin-antitoxin module
MFELLNFNILGNNFMTETIQINERGSLTLPKIFRKKLGLEKGGVVLAESTSEGVVLKPAVAFPIEIYTDERVSEFKVEEENLKKYIKKKAK